MNKISCNYLWKQWMDSDPNDPLVVSCKKRLQEYSKEDWKEMSKEATYLTEMLGELVRYDIPHNSKIAESAFDSLVDHFNKYFFPINKMHLLKLAELSGEKNSQYQFFFNQFQDGLGDYLHKLVPVYLHKVKPITWTNV